MAPRPTTLLGVVLGAIIAVGPSAAAVDALHSELDSETGVGPFFGSLNSNGAAFIGPFTGLPGGLVIYSFVFSIPSVAGPPLSRTAPFAYAIP